MPVRLIWKNRYMYTFENACKEDSEVILNDGAKKVFLNADGKNGAVSGELKAFLDYVAGRPSEDIFVKKLKRAVENAKKNREWRVLDIQGMSAWHGPKRSGERVYDVVNA